MRFDKATDHQLKSIIEGDGECPPSLLYQVLEEVVRRDLYQNYMKRLINNRYKAIRYAEHLTKLSFDEIKYLLYEQAFEALKYFKPGKHAFLGFWSRFMKTALYQAKRTYQAKMRTADLLYIDDEQIQLVDDNNTERKAINRVYLEQLLSTVSEFEQDIILMYNNDMTFQEIGKRYGCSREHVRKKYRNAIEKIKMGA